MKKISLFIGSLFFGLFSFATVNAVCPVCTVAVGAGVGLSRWLGIDDIISGIWIGGLTVSLIIWTLSWLDKKKINFKLRWLAISIAYYLIILLSLYIPKIAGRPSNVFCGVDKLVFGIGAGSIVFVMAVWLHNFLKKKNQDKSFFPYQKVAIPVASLIALSLIFYLTICK